MNLSKTSEKRYFRKSKKKGKGKNKERNINTPMADLQGYLEPGQVQRTIDSADGERNKLLIEFLWRTGRRITEALRVKKKHIDFDKSLILFSILKKRNENYRKMKPIDHGLLEMLRKYCQFIDEDAYIFPSPYKENSHLSSRQAYNIIRSAAERAGIFFVGDKPVHPHTLRHSFAVNFLRKAKNSASALKTLQIHLEHHSMDMTGTYLQFNQEDLKGELDHIFGGKV